MVANSEDIKQRINNQIIQKNNYDRISEIDEIIADIDVQYMVTKEIHNLVLSTKRQRIYLAIAFN